MLAKPQKVYDSLYGFIYLDSIESQFIDTWPFQRLHFIRQLGTVFLVYPGGTHTRFEHSIGTMEIASHIYDQITSWVYQSHFPKSILNFLKEYVPNPTSLEHHYFRRILRLAALSHDLGHLPFSHSAEMVLLGKEGHEAWTLKMIKSSYLKPVFELLQEELHGTSLEDRSVIEDIAKVAIGEEKYELLEKGKEFHFTPWIKVLSHIITGDFFGADRIDYLRRDAKNTGLAYGFFDYHQLIETLRIFPSQKKGEEILQLGIEENGIESCEALLLARYYMHRRIYQHPSVNAYAYHLASFMQAIQMKEKMVDSIESYLSHTDAHVLTQLVFAASKETNKGYRHAKSLLERKGRFRAIIVDFPFSDKEMQKLSKNLKIPSQDISWTINEKPLEDKTALDFPVLRKDGSVVLAKEISQISIPIISNSWIFVSPQHEIEVHNALR